MNVTSNVVCLGIVWDFSGSLSQLSTLTVHLKPVFGFCVAVSAFVCVHSDWEVTFNSLQLSAAIN